MSIQYKEMAYSRPFSVLYCLHNCAAVFSVARGHNNHEWVTHTHTHLHTYSVIFSLACFPKLGHVVAFCYKKATYFGEGYTFI